MGFDIAQANRVARIFGDRSFQLNFKTFTLQMANPTALAPSYPVLLPSTTTPANFKVFDEAVILTAAYLSTTFQGTGIDETACVAISRLNIGGTNLSVLADSDVFLQQTFDASLATPAGTVVQRNVGVSFSAPFWPLIQVNQAITVYGSSHTAAGLAYYTTATVYYVRAQEIAEFLQMANG